MAMLDVIMLAQTSAFDAVAATQAYLDTVPPEQAAKVAAYHEGQNWLNLWGNLLTIAIFVLLLQTGFSKALRNGMERGLPHWLAALPVIFVLLLASTVLTFPFAYYVGFMREHAFDLATQNFGEWFGDYLMASALSLVTSSLALWALYGLMRWLKNLWWIIGAVGGGAMVALLIMASPVYLDPLFNEYTPLEQGELRDGLEAIAEASGIPASDIVVYNASAQTNRITANVSGLGSTVRIALGDTLLDQASEEEILAVMAHEIGHYVLGHTYRTVIFSVFVLAAGFAFVHFSFGWANRRFGKTWDIKTIGDVAGLPLFLAIFTVYSTLLIPVQNNYVRWGEMEADAYGLDAARQPDGFATSALRISTYRKIDPSPLEEFLFHHHPSGRSRVMRAMEWKAEQLALGAADQTPELALERARSIFAEPVED